MKKPLLLITCLFILISSTFANESDYPFNVSVSRPSMTEQEFTQDKNTLLAKNKNYNLSMEFSDNGKCLIKVSSKNSSASYSAKIKREMIEILSVNNFYIDRKTPCILVSYMLNSPSGLSANISYGILVKLNESGISIVELSSFGSVWNNFIDIDNDSSYEFFCEDLFYDSEGNKYFVPNIFSLAGKTKNITDTKKARAKCIEDNYENKKVSLKDLSYPLLKAPVVADFF